MVKKFTTVAELISERVTVAYIKGNRVLNPKNVAQKVKSLEFMGGTVTPLMYVNGEDATAEGLELVNAVTGEPINDASNCIVIIDGQHRFAAFNKSGKVDANKMQMQHCDCPKGIMKTLKAMNGDCTPWNGSDVMGACHLTHPDNSLLALAADMAGKGYPVSTVSLVLCWKGSLKKDHFFNALTNGGELGVTCNIERAEKFLTAARAKFDDKVIKKKYLISAVIALSNEITANSAIDLINKLSQQEVNRISEMKRNEANKEELITALLRNHLAA
jgi:hypothetical protein